MGILKARDIYMKMCKSSKELHVLTDDERMKLQGHLKKMYKDIEKVCNQHGLTVMLADGSVLGAVRHGGFIPWDDDIDLNMPRRDYEEFINKYADELPLNYKVYAPNNTNGPIANFCKVVDLNTEYVLPGYENSQEHKYIAIDIFPLESIAPNRPICNKWKGFNAKVLIFIIASVAQYENRSSLYRRIMSGSLTARISYWIRQVLGIMFSFRSAKSWQNIFDNYVRNTDETGFVHRPSDLYRWEPIPLDVYLPVKLVDFDEIKAYIPHKSEYLLEYDYGDWHYIPKPEERWEHFCVNIKFDNY